jgi:hypothetical protein
VGVDRAQRVVEQVHVRVGVERPRQRHARLLAAAQRDAPLADLGRIAAEERRDVDAEGARLDAGAICV